MSAIAGIWRLDGAPAGPEALGSMMDRLAHRGPDGSGFGCEGALALGYQRLATTLDAATEAIPLKDASGALWLTADARIDNRDELISQLRPASPTPSDAELLLLAYARWGERCVERLEGDFAFALWDARRGELFCGRDAFGVRPFYYCHLPGRLFAFASEIKALLALDEVPRIRDEARMADFLLGVFEDRETTFYAEIRRLPAAHALTVTPRGLKIRPYWELDATSELRLGSDDAYADAFREAFTRAVRSRLRGSGPVGAMLSGGLDSSAVACVAAEVLSEEGRGPLRTYSNVYPRSATADERPYVDVVLARGGMEPRWIEPDELGPITGLGALLGKLDQPPFAGNLMATVALYRRAVGEGRILLDGLHGDNALFSYGDLYLAELLRRGRWVRLGQLLRAHARHHPGRTWSELRSYGIKPLLPSGILAAWQRLRGMTPRPATSLLAGEFARRVDAEGRRAALLARFQQPFRNARQFHHYELTAGITAAALELADEAAAACQIEPRYPFLDRRLVALCFAVPSEQKFLDGWPRSLIRRGMAGVLPEEIRWRRGKRGTAEWFARNLRAFERHRIEALGGNSELAPYLDMAALRRLCEAYLRHGRAADASALWAPLVLADWLGRGLLPSD